MNEYISKSQKKRDADALQKVGVKLIDFPAAWLDKMSLPDDLRQAVNQAKAIKRKGGMRRQVQLIGKLMRSVEPELIAQILQKN